VPFLERTWALESHVGVGEYRLIRPVIYQGRRDTFVVPAGFVTDLASVPRWFTWLIARDGLHTPAAILHDYLCVEAHGGRFARRDADGIFRRVLREEGVPTASRWVLWAAVRVGGRMDGATPAEWAQVAGIGVVMVPALVVPTVTTAGTWWGFRVVEYLIERARR